jgi:hypothetical protein
MSGKGYVGQIAGTLTVKDYVLITVRGHQITAHRLAWWFVHERRPTHQIDHINQIKSDNRIANMREATNAQNHCNRGAQRNSTTKVKGVYWYKPYFQMEGADCCKW